MRTIPLRFAVVLAVATLTASSQATAQTTPPSLLSDVEVRQLIARGEPGDHERLSDHFTILAQRYEADARRHESMGRAFSGNQKLAAAATSLREHCRQLSARNLESAATLRELVAHHTKLATGQPSDPPNSAERFERGAGAPAPSDETLMRLAGEAETTSDHRALEDYFTSLAARYEQDTKRSTAFAASWRVSGSKNPSASGLAARWDRLAREQRASAVEARAAAALHKQQAATTR
ncbi:MAG: hypothetical protein R2745_13440 [Vicinamibacterales bacterium]|jgi:hypothetical protein